MEETIKQAKFAIGSNLIISTDPAPPLSNNPYIHPASSVVSLTDSRPGFQVDSINFRVLSWAWAMWVFY